METTDSTQLPLHVTSVCQSFLTLAERVAWCSRDDAERLQRHACSPASARLRRWLHDVCRLSAFEIDALVRDAHCNASTDDADTRDASQLDALDDLALLRLILSDDTFASIRWAKVRLADALERTRKHSRLTDAAARAWDAAALILPHMLVLPSDDRAASYVLASTIVATARDKTALLEHFPLDASLYPLASRSDLLLAACSARHTRMVAQLLGASTQAPISGDVIVRGLQQACACGASAIVDALLDHYASAPGVWEHHSMLLCTAVESRSFNVVKLLLECDPRGVFTRIDELMDELKRETSESSSASPWLDAIVGRRGFAAWDARALETAVQANDCALFDLLAHHIEWRRDDLTTALATAHAMERINMAATLMRLLECETEDAQSRPLCVLAVGDEVEARKRGRMAFSDAVIHCCYLNGTYDVAFNSSDNGECSDAPALPRIETALASGRIRQRSARRTRLDEKAAEKERDTLQSQGNVIARDDTTTASDDRDGELARDFYDPAPSSLSEDDDDDDDDDDREIRADAAIMDDRALELVSGLDNLLADSDEDATPTSDPPSLSITSTPSTDSIDKLLELQLTPSQSQSLQVVDKDSTHTSNAIDDLASQTSGVSDTPIPPTQSRVDSSETPSRLEAKGVETAEQSGSVAARDVIKQALNVDKTALDDARASDTGKSNTSASEPQYACGDLVDANFLAIGKFHRGRIVQVHTDGDCTYYDVAYAEFDETEARVPLSRLRSRTDASAAPLSVARVETTQSARMSTARPARTPSRSSLRASTSSSAAGAAQSETLVVPLLPTATAATTAAAKRAPLKSARPLTTASSARAAPLSVPVKPPATARRESARSRASARAAKDVISWRELEEWRNVDAILTRKRRVVNSLSGGIESARVPWGEEFAAIQSLKRFAAQHPDVLREHMCACVSVD